MLVRLGSTLWYLPSTYTQFLDFMLVRKIPLKKRLALSSAQSTSSCIDSAEDLLHRMREIIAQDRDLHEKVVATVFT